MEGVPAFLACERIAPVEARGACHASTHSDNTAEGTQNDSSIDISSVISCKGLFSYRKAFMVLRKLRCVIVDIEHYDMCP